MLRASIGSFPGRPFKRKTFNSSQYSSRRSGADDVSQGKSYLTYYLFIQLIFIFVSRCLTQQRVRSNISLVDAAYSEMCALFEAALIEAERNGDFRCAKHLIHMSLTFYRIGIHIYLYILLRLFFKLIIFEVGAGWSDSEAQDYIQNTLRRSELITIWKKQVFWDELFYGNNT